MGVQALDKALPAGTSAETRNFAKETMEAALTDWSDNGKVAANVRLCLGKDVAKEVLPNVAVEKVWITISFNLGWSSNPVQDLVYFCFHFSCKKTTVR